jgi:positive regulator of sigma E activity
VSAKSTCKGCSAAGICNWAGENKKRVIARNQAGATKGQFVVLETMEQGRARSALVVFGLPVILMLAGVLVGGLVFKKDLWAGISSGVGLALGLGVVKLFDIAARRSGRSLPVVTGPAEGPAECPSDGPPAQ